MSDHVVWLIGTGPMAVEYVKVFDALMVPCEVIGRGDDSARAFEAATGHSVRRGGLEAWLQAAPAQCAAAVVATSVESLCETTLRLLDHGVKRILVEKPGGLTLEQVDAMARNAGGAHIAVAYNRRFYSSVIRAREIIEEDGGATSTSFEFTEWPARIEPLVKAPGVKEAWFLVNSTHVVDLAFFLSGAPTELTCRTSGSLPWHPAAARFCGSGVTRHGVLFSYLADWTAPGRWGVEVSTTRRRLILRPLEKLHVQYQGSTVIEEIPLEDAVDQRFKPGLYLQVKTFLARPDHPDLLTMADHAERMRGIFLPMLHGH